MGTIASAFGVAGPPGFLLRRGRGLWPPGCGSAVGGGASGPAPRRDSGVRAPGERGGVCGRAGVYSAGLALNAILPFTHITRPRGLTPART